MKSLVDQKTVLSAPKAVLSEILKNELGRLRPHDNYYFEVGEEIYSKNCRIGVYSFAILPCTSCPGDPEMPRYGLMAVTKNGVIRIEIASYYGQGKFNLNSLIKIESVKKGVVNFSFTNFTEIISFREQLFKQKFDLKNEIVNRINKAEEAKSSLDIKLGNDKETLKDLGSNAQW